MKFVYSTLAVTLLLLAGCKQDFQVTVSHYVDTPVVYGLLSLNETTFPTGPNTHYIRIQKGYLLKGNAYLAAGIEDSIYYPNNLTVKLSSADGYYTYTLNRIDGASVGINKDTGIFANVPNYLYTFNGNLNSDSLVSYILLITRNDTIVSNGVSSIKIDTMASSNTFLVNNFIIYSPSNLGTSTISFSNVNPQTLSWAAADSAGVYDLTIRFFYEEYITATNILSKDTFIDIPIFTSYVPNTTGTTITYTLTSSVILTYMAAHIANNPLVYRTFNPYKGMQFTFAAGGTALASYYNTQLAQSGLSSSNALPPFTNITGGLGLLSSREYTVISDIGLTNMGLDTLACDPTASFLNFKNSSGNVCN